MSEAVDQIMTPLGAHVRYILDGAATDVADDLRKLIAVPVGRGRGGVVVRSRPGQPPRKDTGRLQRSVARTVREIAPDLYRATVRTATPYDTFLENGTGRMAARPFAGPTEAKWLPIVTNRLALATRNVPRT